MACTLTIGTTGNEDFTAAAGSSFTLEMTGPDLSGLVIVSMSYAGTSVTAAPFTFTVASGTNYLFIHFEALVPGIELQVVENCGEGAGQILETLLFDPSSPGTGFAITGI